MTPSTSARVAPKKRSSNSLDGIRKQCLERIKRDREAAQAARRSTPARAASEASCRERARTILDDVLSSRGKRRRSDSGDGEPAADEPGPPARLFDGGDDDDALSAEEEAALVRELLEEIQAYEAARADEHALDLAMEALAAEAAGLAFDEDEALGADDTVLCPVCSRGYLLQGRALEIACASCDLCLPDQLDGLGLGHLRDLLGRTFEAHADRGCDKRPAFAVDRELGVALLRCDCAACGFRHVVI
ncbi:hypothetical protein SO694_00026141 [Aureococcus anophagefferens]|uniref:RPA-interacting protein C-terminal domain-containing protein n=1 Tax=Aureococcus anophagefferens TaxID=44056 RepID=A0ABR1FUE4_AURAN